MKKITLLLLLLPLLSIGQWTQQGNLISGNAGDFLGLRISLNNAGDIVAVSAHESDANGTNSGHIKIYQNNSGIWNQVGADIVGESPNDQFGRSLCINGSGTIVAVGSRHNDGNGTDSGHVRVFENISGVWTQIGADIDGENAGDESGYSVSLSDDGNILAISAKLNDGNGTDSGHVRVFENISGVWTQIGADIDGENAGDESGNSVSLSDDGNILAISARLNDGNGTDSGHVRVFKNISGVWTQIGIDINGEATNDQSGDSISLSDDGDILAIGAWFNDGTGSGQIGHVRVYKNNSGVWVKLGSDIDGEGSADGSGAAVSLNSDGSILAIGAPGNDGGGTNTGHVRVYEYIPPTFTTNGYWQQFGLDIDGLNPYDQLGQGVDISDNGGVLVIGAYRGDTNGASSGYLNIQTEASLSIQDSSFGSSFSVYPNPSNGLSKIQLGESYNEVSVNVFNVLGKQVATQEYNNVNEIELDTQEYATGVYFIKVQSGTKGATIKLVVE